MVRNMYLWFYSFRITRAEGWVYVTRYVKNAEIRVHNVGRLRVEDCVVRTVVSLLSSTPQNGAINQIIRSFLGFYLLTFCYVHCCICYGFFTCQRFVSVKRFLNISTFCFSHYNLLKWTFCNSVLEIAQSMFFKSTISTQSKWFWEKIGKLCQIVV